MKKTAFLYLLLLSLPSFAQDLVVTKLFCESKVAPLGIETLRPSLSWQVASKNRAVQLRAYRILVSDDSVLLSKNGWNMWDSKITISPVSIQNKYAGRKLQPGKTYYWKVMVWDNQKHISKWSSISSWQMGLMTEDDWKGARWIAYEKMPDSLYLVPAEHQKGPAKWQGVKDVLPLLRTTIDVTKPIKRATAFICGLGHFELSANGEKIGDHFLDPGWTKYDKEAQYVAFDVTKNLKQGRNALGVMLGNGFYFIPGERYRKLSGAYGYPKMKMRLQVQYDDNSVQDFISDESWKTSPGPITFSSIYGGEDYNATLEQSGWNTLAFNDKAWRQVMIVDGPATLYHQMNPPLKLYENFTSQKTTKINDGVYVFDLGQNASGIPQIQVEGLRGDTIKIIPGELIKEDGTVTQRATGSPVYFQYILKGDGVETWQPRFSYYGFRYLQVENCTVKEENKSSMPALLQIKGLHTRASAKTVGSFASSSDLFNQIYKLIDWSVKSNMASVLTDCPHREKLGWLEQVYLMGNSIHYNYDVANYFKKTLRDVRTAQGDGLHVPEYVPEFVKMPFMDGIFTDSPEWGSTAVILPWYLYKWYGDKNILEESYSSMQRYLAHLQSKAKDNIVAYGLSDWYDLGPARPGLAQLTPMGLTATATYYYDLTILKQAAKLLDKPKEAKVYDSIAVLVKNAFNQKFFQKDSLYYGTNSQTANAMALYMDLVPVEYRKAVLDNLVKDIRSRNNSITAGDVGFRYLLQVLEKEGRSDIIYDMNSRTDVPGYGFQLAKGATALTESWQALPVVSNNHLMLGHLMEWFYSGLGGIKQAEKSVGYRQVEINPQMIEGITSANTSYESPYGLVKSGWRKTTAGTEMFVSIPVNAAATVYLPTTDLSKIKESGKKIEKIKNIDLVGVESGKYKIMIGSGEYHFLIEEGGVANATN